MENELTCIVENKNPTIFFNMKDTWIMKLSAEKGIEFNLEEFPADEIVKGVLNLFIELFPEKLKEIYGSGEKNNG